MTSISKAKLKKIVHKVVKPYCQCDWCLLKEVVCTSHDDSWIRSLLQLKCLEIFKNDQSRIAGHDIGWQETHMRWIDMGYAEGFAEYYDEEKSAEAIYEEIKVHIT